MSHGADPPAMTSTPRVLVVGRHASIMTKVESLLAAAGLACVAALTDDEALAAIEQEALDALLLGGGVEPSSRARLAAAFERMRPGRPVIEHYGGAHGLVEHVRARLGR